MNATQEAEDLQEAPVVHCRRCGRRLKREPGVTDGIGPVCRRREQAELDGE
jgi:hypothetical protein